MFLGIDGEWFDALLTYLRLLLGFLYGLWEPSVDSVTSRKVNGVALLFYGDFKLVSLKNAV